MFSFQPKWVQAEGYPVETHDVMTQGYIMTVHRIPRRDRPAVLIVHGLFCSSVDWVFHGPQKALGRYRNRVSKSINKMNTKLLID